MRFPAFFEIEMLTNTLWRVYILLNYELWGVSLLMLVEADRSRIESRDRQLRGVGGATLTNPVMRLLAQRRISQWNARAKSPQQFQEEALLRNCSLAAETEFGRAHKLERVRSYEDYRNQVPLRTYADFEPYINRMRKGSRDVLWPGLIQFYGQSSGTSQTDAKHKFLPISHEQIRWQQKAGFDLLAQYLCLSKDRSFTSGYSLGLFPPSLLDETHPGIFTGSNPGIMLRFVPSFAKRFTLPKAPIRDIADYNKKLEEIAKAYLDFDLRSISGTTCWFPVLFDHVIRVAKEMGRNVETVSQVWPNLRVLFGGGVYAGPYKKLIEQKFGRPIVLIDNYNATEGGIFAATDSLSTPGMLMVPDRGVFYEFVPRSEHGKPRPTRFPLWKVEPGVDYSVVLSTSSGLFGYYIGDFVRFTSVFPHRIEFAGRASGMLSLTQELTTYIEIEKSVTRACERLDCTTVDYAASSEVGVNQTGKGRYVLFVEFERAPKSVDEFAVVVDEELCQQNRVYREHRAENVAILPLKLTVLSKGSTQKFMEAIGFSSVQNKFPRIVDETKRDILFSIATSL